MAFDTLQVTGMEGLLHVSFTNTIDMAWVVKRDWGE